MLPRCCTSISTHAFHLTICSQKIPGMGDVGLASLDLHLVDLPTASKRYQSSTSDICVAPIGQPQLHIVLRLEGQCMARPRKQRLSLADDPVISAVQIDRDYT